jgi:hypothetical protein
VCALRDLNRGVRNEINGIQNLDKINRTQKRLYRKEGADEVMALIERSQNDKLAGPDCKATGPYRWRKVSELQSVIVAANAIARSMCLQARQWHDCATRTKGSNMSKRWLRA